MAKSQFNNPLFDDTSTSATLENCAGAISFLGIAVDSIEHNGGGLAKQGGAA